MKANPIVEQRLMERLNAAIGLDPQALEPARLRWIVAARCRQLRLADASAYAAFLDSEAAEMDALIDQVVVRETRFFRDPAVFEHIRGAMLRLAAAAGELRLLSAPCGTGEEAYSLAATLLWLGLPPARFTIDAIDISRTALETAVRGVYAERAGQTIPVEMQAILRGREGGQWRVPEALRERIVFKRRNLAEPGALRDARYHLILCRNLFIYLAPAARATLAHSLSAALLPGGRLFLGSADRVQELNALFAPLRPAASFAFTHREAAAPAAKAKEPPAPRKRLPLAPIRRPEKAQETAPDSANLIAARELYERALTHRQDGELARAERRCRQALYLAPNHLPAMELLQTLWDANPNLRLRRALGDRILRHRLTGVRDE